MKLSSVTYLCVCESLLSVSSVTPFCCCKFLVNAAQSCTITCRSFSPFHSAEPLKLWVVGWCPPMNCFLRSFHNILIGLRSGLWLSHFKILTLFFFNHSLVDWLVCLGCCLAAWPMFSSDSVFKQTSWSVPLEFAGIIYNSLFHQWWQALLAMMQQIRRKPSYYHHHDSQMG